MIKDGTERIKRESRANRGRSRRCNPDLTGGEVSFFGIPRMGDRLGRLLYSALPGVKVTVS